MPPDRCYVFLVLVLRKKKAALHTSDLLDNHYKSFSFLCSTGIHLEVILYTQVASSFLKVPRRKPEMYFSYFNSAALVLKKRG